jgi:alpha-ketoglutaric semialdehyde dehydrogenase
MATAVTPKSYKNYINGEWVEGSGGAAIEDRNPANRDELIGMFPSST